MPRLAFSTLKYINHNANPPAFGQPILDVRLMHFEEVWDQPEDVLQRGVPARAFLDTGADLSFASVNKLAEFADYCKDSVGSLFVLRGNIPPPWELYPVAVVFPGVGELGLLELRLGVVRADAEREEFMNGVDMLLGRDVLCQLQTTILGELLLGGPPEGYVEVRRPANGNGSSSGRPR